MTSQLKPFRDLTVRGQVRRMRALAWNALAQYDLKVAGLHLLGWFTNLMFRVMTTEGQKLVLRICASGWRTDEDRRAEVAWLLALANEPTIEAPILQPAQNGAYIVEASAPGVPGVRPCLLMSWVPGTNLGKHLNETNLTKMGSLFARMHRHGASWTPPHDFPTRRMDRVLARDEPDVLFTEATAEAFTPYTRQVWENTCRTVEAAYSRLYSRDGLQVIHHDLWHDNIKLHHGRLYPLDFEDTVWGYPIQDIAMAMQDLMSDVPAERYEPLLQAFRRGYEDDSTISAASSPTNGSPKLGSWPETYEGEMDTFRAGRMLWVANYVAGLERHHLRDFLTRSTPILEGFLRSGKMRKTASEGSTS